MPARSKKTQVCMVGDFSERLDEGYKNTSHYLARHLGTRNEVVRLNAKEITTVRFWRTLASSKPQIVHTISQPTHQSLLVTRMIRQMHPRARTVVSALKADKYFPEGTISTVQRKLVPATRPDLVLVQSGEAEDIFRELGCKVQMLPNGVDLERFQPVGEQRKVELRSHYGIDASRPVALHVGHLNEERNLLALEPVVARGIQVVVAGSLYMGINHELIERLENSGFHLLKGYQPNIEELYQLADCYVFPTQPGNSLTTPLSVLEAMATNLPVVTTHFPGLVQAFEPGHGFQFIDEPGEIEACVQRALLASQRCHTREMVQGLSWEAVSRQLESYYEELLAA